jgi:redox-sensitive bicupin YhaK (pirin superfamily)
MRNEEEAKMIKLHRSDDRGTNSFGWLDTRHTFSFGHFYDPSRIRFKSLRVLNEDVIAGGSGFPTHPHEDMEIITYVLEGALAHEDSSGGKGVIRPGDIQKMSAGSGVEHSEFNHSKTDPAHLLQIWIIPDEKGIKPSYEQVTPDPESYRNKFAVVAEGNGSDQSVSLHQKARMLLCKLERGKTVTHDLKDGQAAFLHLARGEIKLEGEVLKAGDAAEITGLAKIDASATMDAEMILFIFD